MVLLASGIVLLPLNLPGSYLFQLVFFDIFFWTLNFWILLKWINS